MSAARRYAFHRVGRKRRLAGLRLARRLRGASALLFEEKIGCPCQLAGLTCPQS